MCFCFFNFCKRIVSWFVKTNVGTFGLPDKREQKWINGWMNGQMDRRMDGQTDRWMDGYMNQTQLTGLVWKQRVNTGTQCPPPHGCIQSTASDNTYPSHISATPVSFTCSYLEALWPLLYKWRLKCLFSCRKSWSSFSWAKKTQR